MVISAPGWICSQPFFPQHISGSHDLIWEYDQGAEKNILLLFPKQNLIKMGWG